MIKVGDKVWTVVHILGSLTGGYVERAVATLTSEDKANNYVDSVESWFRDNPQPKIESMFNPSDEDKEILTLWRAICPYPYYLGSLSTLVVYESKVLN